ncbi:ROK family glucokinase [Aquibacillus sp. 3ASR75-11]|uniref:Glucokinase n=1 Tax=Terrihalobacillus insolitus TaxID=2950438 RepID=A0A9X3WS30_9BACI|nr:ROK family glucokinase [Terrihalobacillus insolitus]MDC3413394.1 ROK family glucokinase [Terrihalobacillus insolitus]MDC3424977.1 ROK family glucokinase [Terrihalobacillus insolitus]
MKKPYYIGIDIGGTSVKMAFVDNNGSMMDKWEIPTNKMEKGAHVPLEIWASIVENMDQNNISKQDVAGIGVGAPGFVHPITGIISEAVNIGWKNFDLRNEMETISGLPTYVDNDANIAALGENWKGAGRKSDYLIAVTLGTGVGGGIIANGKILKGVNGTAGEIGHMTVDPSGIRCNCGRKGCLETIASATGIVRKAKEGMKQNKHSMLTVHDRKEGDISAKDVFAMAEKGDQLANQIVEDITNTLGLAISNLAIAINPSKIVIGGGVSKAGESLLKPLRKAFDKHALPRISKECEFVIAQLGNDAGVFGGAYIVKQAMKMGEPFKR